jgi:hypothetical protein
MHARVPLLAKHLFEEGECPGIARLPSQNIACLRTAGIAMRARHLDRLRHAFGNWLNANTAFFLISRSTVSVRGRDSRVTLTTVGVCASAWTAMSTGAAASHVLFLSSSIR